MWRPMLGFAVAASFVAVPSPAALSAGDGHALARDLLASSPGDAVRAVASVGGARPAQGPVAAIPWDPPLDRVPATVRPSIERLLGAMARAEALRDEALAGVDPALVDRVARTGRLSDDRPGVASVGGVARPPTTTRVDAVHGLDLAKLASAAALVVDAVEREVRVLRTAGVVAPVDMCPTFAVDGAGDSTWTADCALIVDLAGNDTYTGSAATNAVQPVGVVVDLAGDDTYVRSADADALVAQGAGVTGVGVLFDALGDDTYEASVVRAPVDLQPSEPANVIAQGAGVLGAGVLIDLAGDDTFLSRAATRGGAALVAAQGAATAGVGVLVHGPGSASFETEAVTGFLKTHETPDSVTFEIGSGTVVAQGGALIGAGGLVSAGGDDVYSIRTEGAAAALTVGQGGAQVGAGVLVDGGGADRYGMEAVAEPLLRVDRTIAEANRSARQFVGVASGSSLAVGQGGGTLGAGIAVDVGTEANERLVRSVASATAEASIRYTGLGTSSGAFEAVADANGGDASAFVHGAGGAGGGVSIGGTGADRYEVEVEALARAVATATGGASNVRSADAAAGDSAVDAQASAPLAVAALVDAAGDDAYDVRQRSEAEALENGVRDPSAEHEGTVTTRGRARTEQAGVALLLDGGGDDSYGPLAGGDPGGNGRCWTNSPPGVEELDTAVATGADLDPATATGCVPPPT